MSRLIQIIYISRSSFITTTNSTEIEPNVARILAKSRVNNRKNGLVGVLYFGDGCFFQCLEGEETEVDKLYSKLDELGQLDDTQFQQLFPEADLNRKSVGQYVGKLKEEAKQIPPLV